MAHQIESFVMHDVAANTWRDNGGDGGEISYFAGELLVMATPEVLRPGD